MDLVVRRSNVLQYIQLISDSCDTIKLQITIGENSVRLSRKLWTQVSSTLKFASIYFVTYIKLYHFTV